MDLVTAHPIAHYVQTSQDGDEAKCSCGWSFKSEWRHLRGAAIHQHIADMHMAAHLEQTGGAS